MKDRDLRIDFARAFACIMVLFCHAPQHYVGQGGKFIVGIDNYFGMAWGPILFFVISGACILGKEEDAFSFLKRRFSRILFPTIFWSFIYILVETFWWHTSDESNLVAKFFMVFISPQYSLFWFMYALAGIYLVAPVISRWLNNCTQKEVLFYLLLWSITLMLPYFELSGVDFSHMVGPSGFLFYFNGFLGYAVAGFYCRKYINIEKLKFCHYLIIALAILSPFVVFVIKHCSGKLLDHSGCFLPMITTLVAFNVILNSKFVIRIMSGRLKYSILFISKHSFGIYLTHMLFMYPIRLWILRYHFNYIIQIPLTVLVVGVFSIFFVWLLSYFPLVKNLTR